MSQNKPIILLDPYPRTMDILFSKENLNQDMEIESKKEEERERESDSDKQNLSTKKR